MNMKPKNRKSKFTKQECDRIKEPGTYFFNDTPAVALRVSRNRIKSVYASYSVVVGTTADGKLKRHGRYKFICRLGAKPIEEIKLSIAQNISDWKKTPDAGAVTAPTVGTLIADYRKPGAAKYRVKQKGGKLGYKQKTKDGYIRALNTYVMMDTNEPEILDRLTSKFKIYVQFNSDILNSFPILRDKL